MYHSDIWVRHCCKRFCCTVHARGVSDKQRTRKRGDIAWVLAKSYLGGLDDKSFGEMDRLLAEGFYMLCLCLVGGSCWLGCGEGRG